VEAGNAAVEFDARRISEIRRQSYRSMFWLATRECLRVSRLWSQTVMAPVISSLLFVIVFGLAIGGRIKQVGGVDYQVFILPGLVAMAMITASYSNNSSSIFQARSDRYIDDVLAAPMSPWQMDVGLLLILAALLSISMFASLGVIVGIHAETWDHNAFVQNLLIQPLAFLGGVFYSITILPSPWEQLSYANPIFYMVECVRWGFLGTSDVPVGLAFGITAVLAAVTFSWTVSLFRTGRRLKP